MAAAAEPVRRARRAARPGRRRPGARPRLRQPRAARRPAGADRAGRQAARAAARRDVAATGRLGRARGGGRRDAERQVHRAAHAGLRARAHPHPGRGAGLLPRLRRRLAGHRCGTCRTSAGSPAGSTRSACGVPSARSPPCSPSGSRGSPRSASTRWRPTGGAGPTATAARRRADGDPFGDVFLVIDGWATLRKEYEELEPVITDIATRGLSYGIHVVAATSSRWMDFRPAIRDLFGSRLELRLGDPSDSMVNRRAAINVPEKPGRGIVEHPTDKNKCLHLLTVRPELSTLADTTDAGQGGRDQLARPARPAGADAAAVGAVRRPGPGPQRRPAAADRHLRGRPAAGRDRLRDRPALPAVRRRRVRQVVVPAGAGHHGDAAVLPGGGPDHPGRLPAQPDGPARVGAPHRVRHAGAEDDSS